jgi:GAF domain-containing protein
MIAALQTMADQVGVALDNAHLFTESQAALEASRRAYGELSRQAWRELMRAHPEWAYSYANQTITTAQGTWRPEMLQAAQTNQKVQSQTEEKHKLAIPLNVRDQVIGVLSFEKDTGNGTWDAEEIAVLETLVDQLGQALESARLFQDTRRRAERERLTSQITDEIRRATSVEGVVQTAVDALFTALGTSHAFGQLEAAPPLPDAGRTGHRQ